ncbi:MAG: hypothetical protein AB8F34_06980 [Akkermansiaceae bacterium]
MIPTLEGGLVIQPESEADWMVLETISTDIGRPAHLAESLAGLMDDEDDWEEYVVPDLEKNFSSQCKFVQAAIDDAREHNGQGVFIKRHDAEKWYGAINQARLSLEARYELHGRDAFDDAPAELKSAHFRDRFYLQLQSILLDYVMEDGE